MRQQKIHYAYDFVHGMKNKIEYKFTLESAFLAKEKDSLIDWGQDYLRGEGNNIKLVEFLKENKIIWVDLVEYDLNKLSRAIGPEKEMVFYEDQEMWNKRINSFVDLITNGFKPSPIIATDFWNGLTISDGSHRFEALKKAGFKKYWTIFYIKNIDSVKVIRENT